MKRLPNEMAMDRLLSSDFFIDELPTTAPRISEVLSKYLSFLHSSFVCVFTWAIPVHRDLS